MPVPGGPRALRDERVPRHSSKPRRSNLLVLVADAGDLADEPLPPRPRTRDECADGPRPCPWVGCRYNLFLDVNPQSGAVILNFPGLEPHEVRHSCALDRASEGEHSLEEIGAVMNLSRERARQIEGDGIARLLEDPARARVLRDLLERAGGDDE